MKRELKPGDRVRVSGFDHMGCFINQKGTIIGLGKYPGSYCIRGDDDSIHIIIYHRNLIPLKKKPKIEPRRHFANRYAEGISLYYYDSKETADRGALKGRIECIEFVEVIKKVKK